jgi:hypothetical protein
MNHKWSDPVTFPHKTERSCLNPGCTVIKVTRHEPGENPSAWREWWKDGERLADRPTPPCEAGAQRLSGAA